MQIAPEQFGRIPEWKANMKQLTLTLLACWLASPAFAAERPVQVLVWDEQQPEQKQAYGDKFLGKTIAAYLLG